MQSRLEMRNDELTTMHEAQTKVAAELEQLCTQSENRTFESVECTQLQKMVKDPRSVRKSVVVPKTVLRRLRRWPIPPFAQSAMSSRVVVMHLIL